MRKLITLLAFITICINSIAQVDEALVEKYFVILGSYKKYQKALSKTHYFSEKLSISVNLRNLTPDTSPGLTSDEVCGCGEKHGYIPRGRYDDGKYISIEFENAFDVKTQTNRYLIIAASGDKDMVEQTLLEIKPKVKKARIYSYLVYVGCMH